jgi:hypothetical protein
MMYRRGDTRWKNAFYFVVILRPCGRPNYGHLLLSTLQPVLSDFWIPASGFWILNLFLACPILSLY